MAKSLVCQFSA